MHRVAWRGAARPSLCPTHLHNMDSIYQERQEGQLCAQHCLNNLLQGPYFTAVDLAGFANELDQDEKERMAEGGPTNPDFLRFMQVIAKALGVWSLEMVPLSSPRMKQALENPTSQQAFICNHDYHWLTVRKLGQQWFNLNSLLKRPELISDTYLSLFLHQLQMEGYAIFVVTGSLPACEADDVLTLVRVEPPLPPPQPPRGGDHTHTTSPMKQQAQSKVPPQKRGGYFGSKRHSESKASSYHSKYCRSESDQYGYVDEEEEKEEDDHALQMAMAMSVSLHQSQEKEEIDQQMCLHSEYGGDPLINSNEGRGQMYGPEEEEAALTAAIYASLEDREEKNIEPEPGGEESVESAEVSQREQALQMQPEEERAKEKEGQEEGGREKNEVEEQAGQGAGDGKEAEVEATGVDREEGSREEGGVQMSQEELRIRRLKHLDKLPDS